MASSSSEIGGASPPTPPRRRFRGGEGVFREPARVTRAHAAGPLGEGRQEAQRVV